MVAQELTRRNVHKAVALNDFVALCALSASGSSEYYNIEHERILELGVVSVSRGAGDGLFVLAEHVDVGEVASQAVKVEAKADDEFFGDGKAHVVGLDVGLQSFGLEEQGGDFHAFGGLSLNTLDQTLDSESGVDDVFNDDHVTSGDVLGEAEHLLDHAGGGCAFVAL